VLAADTTCQCGNGMGVQEQRQSSEDRAVCGRLLEGGVIELDSARTKWRLARWRTGTSSCVVMSEHDTNHFSWVPLLSFWPKPPLSLSGISIVIFNSCSSASPFSPKVSFYQSDPFKCQFILFLCPKLHISFSIKVKCPPLAYMAYMTCFPD
jgi:hypothetical protein